MNLFGNRKVTMSALIIAVLLIASVFVVPAFAANGQEPTLPWEGLEIPIGTFTISWMGLIYSVIQALKSVRKADGRPILETEDQIWFANLVLGSIGVILAAIVTGESLGQAVIAGGLAFFAASGAYRWFKEKGLGFLLPKPKEPSDGQESQAG